MAKDTAGTGILYKGKKFAVERRKVKLPDGRTPVYDLVVHGGAVVILAFPKPGEILLLRQYRPAVGGWLWEIPAGTLEENEDPKYCAGRELEEECGYVPGKLTKLCEFYPSPGVMTEKMWVYVATKLKKTKQHLDEHEVLESHQVPLKKALKMAASGEIRDAKTLTSILLWHLKNG